MRENWKYYKKKLSLVLFVLALILGFHGLYSYYSAAIEQPWKVLSAVLYGMIKMFLFVAPLSPEADTSVSYEIAKWLAPVLTSALVLTKITNAVFHFRNSLKNRLSKKHIVIFEKTDEADALIHNLLGRSEGYQISLVCKNPIASEWKIQYEKSGVAVHLIDFDYASPKEAESFLREIKINSVKSMIFASADDLQNYALFIRIIRKLRPKSEINCYIQCKSSSVPLYLEEIVNQEKRREASLSGVDIIPFNRNELSVRLLMDEIGTQNGILRSEFRKLGEISREKNLSVESIEEAFGQTRFLILGANELLSPLLSHLVNDAVLTTGKKIRVTVVDKDGEAKMADFLSRKEEILEALEIEAISADIRYRYFEKLLRSWSEGSPFTAIFFLTEDTIGALSCLNVVDRYFSDVPKVFRNLSGVDLKPLLPKGREEIRIFGDIKEVMTEDILIRTYLDKKAKDFNHNYNRASSLAGMGDGSEWSELSQTKKNSSRASASHARVKEEILRSLYPAKTDEELKRMLNGYFEEFKFLEEIHKNSKEEFQKEFRLYLDRHPVLDFLARLEHKRWCNSYYAMNFKYGEVKDEKNKTHPCLIEDWNVVIGEKFEVCHPEYDLIATFALFSEEDRNE